MRKAGCASLVMYYYDFREDQKKDLRLLLSSVLFQLCDQSDSYYNILSAFHSAHRDGAQRPGDDKLVRCLRDLLKIPEPLPVLSNHRWPGRMPKQYSFVVPLRASHIAFGGPCRGTIYKFADLRR